MIKKSVIDINSGLGGRAYAFLKAGYKIEVLLENDKENCNILKSVFNDVQILEDELTNIDVSQFPDTGVISAKYIYSNWGIPGREEMDVNEFIFKAVKQKKPNVFILEVLPSIISIRHKREIIEEYLQRFRILGYDFSYSVVQEELFSGYPVFGKQAFFVGIMNGKTTDLEFLFQTTKSVSTKDLILENSESIDSWYRKIRFDYKKWESGKFYTLQSWPKKGMVASDHIQYGGFGRENYIVDEFGPRKITHNEFSKIKGLYEWNFNMCKNKRRMYVKLATETNVFIVYNIAKQISKCFEDNIKSNANECIIEVETKDKKKAKDEKKVKDESKTKIVFPKLFIKEMRIKKLKGIYNLNLEFEKNLTAIMGVNGIGKSTIIHALACVNSRYENGEEYKLSYFFVPTTDTMWKDSSFTVVTYDENEKETFEKEYLKKESRWINYANRPKRDVYYLGVSTCIPEIEIEKCTSRIKYTSNQDSGKNAKKIISDASYILNKDYADLLLHKASKKKYIGVSTQEGVTYSSLSMGAGEQRVIKILQTIYNAHQYSMILIDELDLLLHADAFRKLVKVLSEVALQKSIQVIFTTHSLEMAELSEFADIRYIEKTPEKYMVYNSIKPDLLYSLSGRKIKKYVVYVEDVFAEAIVRKIAKDTQMLRHISIITFGSIENGFTVAAGFVLGGNDIGNVLVVTDGDRYILEEEKKKQLEKVLSGNESWHEKKIEEALSIITQFNLPNNMAPEQYIWNLLKKSCKDSECVKCARRIKTVKDTHDYIKQIKSEMGCDDKDNRIYDDIIDIVSEDCDWDKYVCNVKNWLSKKAEEVNL